MYILIKLFLQTESFRHLMRYKNPLVWGIFRQISRNRRGYKLYRFHLKNKTVLQRMIAQDIDRYIGDTITLLSNLCSKDIHNTHQGLGIKK